MINEAFETGQFSSVLRGLNAVDRPGVTGMLLDARGCPAGVGLNRSRGAGSAPGIACADRAARARDGSRSSGADRSVAVWRRFARADPSAGAKPIVRAHVSPAGDVVVDDDGAFIDIDTPEEYAPSSRTCLEVVDNANRSRRHEGTSLQKHQRFGPRALRAFVMKAV